MTRAAWERLLTKTGLLNDAQVQEAAGRPQPLQWIVDHDWTTRDRLLPAIAGALKIEFTTFEHDAADATLIEEIGAMDRWRPRHLIPLVSRSHRVRLAMSDPMDLAAIDEFTATLQRRIEPVLALPADIDRQYERLRPARLPSGLKVCPQCEGDLIPIVYGYPGPEMLQEAERGEILLGGCVVGDDDPHHRCKNCGRQYL
jgi:hypothetical protein